LRSHETPNKNLQTVPRKIRWLAIAAGVFSGVAGSLPFGPLFAIIPSLLILGAIIQPYTPRPGRWLLYLGAFVVSVYASLFLAPGALEIVWTVHLRDNLAQLTLFILVLSSIFLIGWCDIEIIRDALKTTHTLPTADHNFPGAADWVVGFIAVCVTSWGFWTSVEGFLVHRRMGRLDILILPLGFTLVFVLFDLALVIHTIKMWRARQVSRTTPGVSSV
jgi:hypothetical protein